MLPISDLLFENTRNMNADFIQTRFEKNVNVIGILNVAGSIGFSGPVIVKTLDGGHYDLQTPDKGLKGYVLTTDGVGATYWASGSSSSVSVVFNAVIMTQVEFDALTVDGLYINQVDGLTGLPGSSIGCSFNRSSGINTVSTTFVKLPPSINVNNYVGGVTTNSWIKNINIAGSWIAYNSTKVSSIDSLTATTLPIGSTVATEVTLGKAGVTTTITGTLSVTGTGVGIIVAGSITGDIKPTVTNVNNLGALLLSYNNAYINNILVQKIDTAAGALGNLIIGNTNATGITIGKTGVTTSTDSTLELTATGVGLSIAGTIIGDIKPTVTNVNNLGSAALVYNNAYIGSCNTSILDSTASGILTIGSVNATGINFGKAGVNTTTSGTVSLFASGIGLSLAGSITGDIKPTITNINNIGSSSLLYKNVYAGALRAPKFDTLVGSVGDIIIGDTITTGITLGKAGVNTTTNGVLALTGIGVNMTLAGTLTGDIKPTVTNVNNLGTQLLTYSAAYVDLCKTAKLDTVTAGVLSVGDMNATGITLGKAGVTTTTAGVIALTSTGVNLTLAGTITGNIIPTITGVNNLGSPSLAYNNAYIKVIQTSKIDTVSAGVLAVGPDNALSIILGKTGVITSTAGTVVLSGTGVDMTLAGTITGDIKPTVTMVNKLGSATLLYAESYTDLLRTATLDTGAAGAAGILSIGPTNATGITLGKAGVTTTTAGIVALTATGVGLAGVGMTLAGTITGDIKPTVTKVNTLGTSALLYSESYTNAIQTSKLDSINAGTLIIGDTIAAAITIGKTGVTTTTAGTVALTGTGVGLTVAGTITGDIKPTVTLVNNLGSSTLLYAELNADSYNTAQIDTLGGGATGTLSIGGTNANAITIGKTGVTTTTAGTLALTGTGVGLTLAGTITGDIKPTVTKANNLGSSNLLYSEINTDSCKTSRIDTGAGVAAGVLSIGDTNATGITLGKTGVTTTMTGVLALTATGVGLAGVGMTLAGTITGDIKPTTTSMFKLGTDALPYLSSNSITQSNTTLKVKNGALNGTLITSASTTANLPFIMPAIQGTSGQILTNDGVGNTSWITLPSGGVSGIMCSKTGGGVDQVIGNTSTIVSLTVIKELVGNINSYITNSIVINATGYYTVNGNINIQTGGLTTVYAEIYKNNIVALTTVVDYTDVRADNILFNKTMQLISGDIINYRVYTSNTNGVTIYQNSSTYMSVTYIGSLTNISEIADSSQRWVSSITGNDLTGTGTLAMPWLSISKGFTLAMYPLKINIKGSFTENISLVTANINTEIITGDESQTQQSTLNGSITTQSGFSTLKLNGLIISNTTGAVLTFNDGNGKHSIQNCKFISTNSVPIFTNTSFTNWLYFQDCDFTGLTGVVTLPTLTGAATARFINCGLVNISIGAGWIVYTSGNTEFLSTTAVLGQVLKAEFYQYTAVIKTQAEFNAINVNGLYINQVTGLTGLVGSTFGCSFKYDGINKVSLNYNELPPSINVLNAALNYDTLVKNKNIAGGWIVYDATKTTELDSITVTTLPIGAINATGITLGKAGVTTTTAGTLAITATGVGMLVAGTITGDIRPTVTKINNLGSSTLLYAELNADSVRTSRIDTMSGAAAGTLLIGDINATGITLGKSGVTTTTAGTVSLTNTGVCMTTSGTISGDILPTVNGVNNLGSATLLYNNVYSDLFRSPRLDTVVAGTLTIGATNATGITLGKTGVTTTSAGALALTSTGINLSIAGTITGDIRPTVTKINNLGSTALIYNNSYTNNSLVTRLDTITAGNLSIGTNAATRITIGKVGVTTTSAGTVALTSTGVGLLVAGTITGDIKPTASGVNNLGSSTLLYSNVYTNAIQTSRLDTITAGTLFIGDINATGITLGKSGVTTTDAGTMALTGSGEVLLLSGTITGTIKPTVTLVNNLGSLSLIYGNSYVNATLSPQIDVISSGNLLIGTSTATGISFGKAGVTTTSAGTLALTSVGVNMILAGTITGDIKPTVTDTNNLGSSSLVYNTSNINNMLGGRFDTSVAGTLLIGDTMATAITLGKVGVTTTTAGTLILSGTGVNMTIAGTITGDIKPTVTNVNNLGSALLSYNNMYVKTYKTSAFDTGIGGTLLIGDINATSITIGKTGVITTMAGTLALTATGVGMTLAGTITGDIKPTVTNVNNLGTSSIIYNTAYMGTLRSSRIDTVNAGTLLIGDTNAMAITLGKSGVTTTTAGILALTATDINLTIAGTVTGNIIPTDTLTNNLGTTLISYNNTYVSSIQSARIDTVSAGTLLIGDTTATAITLGKIGVNVTTAGTIALTSNGVNMTLTGTILGDLRPTVTSVNNLGSALLLYNTSYTTNMLGNRFDTLTAGTLLIGDTTATAISLGKTGVTVATAGTIALTATGVGLTLAGTITGDIKPTVTGVNNLGSSLLLYNSIFAASTLMPRIDTVVAGTLLIGDINATSITLGKTGITTTTAGTVALTGTGICMTTTGTITGDIRPTVTNVNNFGTALLAYNTSFTNTNLGSRIDTYAAGTLGIGSALSDLAAGITLGKAGVTTTSAGAITLSATGLNLTVAGTITGDIKPQTTNNNSLGSATLLYNNAFITNINSSRIDALPSGVKNLLIGDTVATGITLGKTGVNTTTVGTLALTATGLCMTLAGTITGTIKPTVTGVNNLGTLALSYNTSYINTNLSSRFDTMAAGTLLIGNTTTNGITIGKTGITTTTAGTLALTATTVNLTLAGSITGDIKPTVANVNTVGSSTVPFLSSEIVTQSTTNTIIRNGAVNSTVITSGSTGVDNVFKLPTTVGLVNQIATTNGTGQLSWFSMSNTSYYSFNNILLNGTFVVLDFRFLYNTSQLISISRLTGSGTIDGHGKIEIGGGWYCYTYNNANITTAYYGNGFGNYTAIGATDVIMFCDNVTGIFYELNVITHGGPAISVMVRASAT